MLLNVLSKYSSVCVKHTDTPFPGQKIRYLLKKLHESIQDVVAKTIYVRSIR